MSQPKTKQMIARLGQALPLSEALALAADGVTQRQIAARMTEKLGVPVSQYYVSKWLNTDPEGYKQARQAAAQNHADKVNQAIERVEKGELDPASARVVMDGAKWLASKLDPATYGDKLEAHITTLDVTTSHLDALRTRLHSVIDVTPDRQRASESGNV